MTVETVEITGLEPRHIGAAVDLSKEARWNQTEADWALMMEVGSAFGVEDATGRLIASALTIPCGRAFGWVSMVLVTAPRQGEGLARRLLRHCSHELEGAGLTPVVDATPAGEAIYRAMGFVGQFGLNRWEHGAVEDIDLNRPHNGGLAPIDMSTVLSLDADAFGGDRRAVLEGLARRSAGFSCQNTKGCGYLLGRDGRVASQIGPIVAAGPQDAIGMLDHALANLHGPVFIDVGDHQTEFIDRLKTYGFKPQRPFLRMVKGDRIRFDVPADMFAMAGPELG
ncbi:hypothetical protein MNBD_ALPHA09-2247 [hydrothermal vent metagenome]|uniref:N-acetyltransferase domain-containing protein n=1 Tax=hydrothermal vent metagenome TaxID=652676 RepID=A0A3B0TDC2_9ZZZZ